MIKALYSVTQLLKRFICSLKTRILFGQDVSQETFEERMIICFSCKHRQNRICSVCQCFLFLKVKWNTERCPIKKW